MAFASAASSKRGFSRPIYTANLDIRTAYAQEIVERSFADTSKAIFAVSVIMRATGVKADVDAVEAQVNEKLQVCKDELEKNHERVRLIIEQSKIEIAELDYTAPLAITLKIDSPRLSRYLGIIKKLDELCQTIDSAWMIELISDEQRANWLHEARRSVRSASGVIFSLYTRSEKLARKKKISLESITNSGEQLTNVISIADHVLAGEGSLTGAALAEPALTEVKPEVAAAAPAASEKKKTAKSGA